MDPVDRVRRALVTAGLDGSLVRELPADTSTAEAAAQGYTQQSGRIYSEDGELCALSRQCMVYFGNRGS